MPASFLRAAQLGMLLGDVMAPAAPRARSRPNAAARRGTTGKRSKAPRTLAAQLSHALGSQLEISRAERLRLLDGIERALDGVYTHLPLKRARYGVDPVQRLRILRTQVDELSNLGFHLAVSDVVTRLRDAHTRYTGPAILASKVAALPFLVEMIGSVDAPTYVVTKVGRGVAAPFRPGVLIEYWNGVPIDRAVQIYSDREVGGRPDSERANAVLTLTLRSLQYGPPPDEHWVVVGYRRVNSRGAPVGAMREIRIPWRIVDPDAYDALIGDTGSAARATSSARAAKALRRARAVNPASEAIRRAKMLMFAPKSLGVTAAATATVSRRRRAARATSIETSIPGTLRVNILDAPGGPYGHLRIWAFDEGPEVFIPELLRIIPELPENGCIIDVRGNPGGYIWAAEQALQLFTPNRIEPTRFSVLATPFTRALAALPTMSDDLGPWRPSLDAAVRNGEMYAQPIPITSPVDCNTIGQRYGGPVVLVADATTYSSGDLFSAGFVDNGMGPFVCVGSATGAGGANVWDYAEMQHLLRGSSAELPALPAGVGLSLSFRRATRAGPSEGLPIEDVGISGMPYAMTRDDVLDGNRDLLRHCVKLLRAQPVTVLRAAVSSGDRTIAVDTRGLDRLDVVIDGRPVSSERVTDRARISISYPARARLVDLAGYAGDDLRQRRRLSVKR
jgi:hypothetical protein